MNIVPNKHIQARILVVDDNLALGNLIAHALAQLGHFCVLEQSLSGARTRLGSELFDMILLDNDLPDGKGEDFLSEVARGQSALVVLMSWEASVELEDRSRGLGAFAFLAKPLSINRVAALAEIAARSLSERTVLSGGRS